MTTDEFISLCKLNHIDTTSVVVGYITYSIYTTNGQLEYQSFLFYNIDEKSYYQYPIERADIKKLLKKNNNVLNIKASQSTTFVDIKLDRWFGLPDKYTITDIDSFLKYNGMDNKKT